jgi:hypothetical protein
VKYPFSQARWEHDSQHFFFLPKQFRRLEEAKPTYLIGTRGTGKTTLLRALNWEERLQNRSLQRQLHTLNDSDDYFAGHYVGVYFKLPRVQLELFDNVLGVEHPLYTNLSSLYLGFNWVDLLAEATMGLLDAGVIEFTALEERHAAQAGYQLFRDSPLVARYLGEREVRSLRELAIGIRRIRRHLERTLQGGSSLDDLGAEFPVGKLSEFADVYAKAMLELFPHDEADPWYFLVCMDEGESLTEAQQRTMNSLIRVSERPLLPVVAYLSRPRPLTETTGQLTTTNADVDVISIEDMSDREFRGFVEGVATVRIQEATQDWEVEIDLYSILGDIDLNSLLERILKTSTDSWGKELLAEAEAARDQPFYKELRSTAPPIYQVYLVKTLDIELPQEGTPSWKMRKQKSAEIRKKNAAAYLSICRRVNAQPLYASAVMLLQMSDLCVRDFLWQLHEIYLEANLSPDKFVGATGISVEAQNRAFRKASANKIDRVGDFILADPTTVSRLVDGLGKLTAGLQRPSEKRLRDGFTRHLRSNEPGAFRPPSNQDLTDHPDIIELIHEATDASYLRLVPGKHNALRFRVHTSLAAYYEFSYRGAYSDTVLSLEELTKLCKTADEEKREDLIAKVIKRMTEEKPEPATGTISLLEIEDEA